jgi:hypothetical protein
MHSKLHRVNSSQEEDGISWSTHLCPRVTFYGSRENFSEQKKTENGIHYTLEDKECCYAHFMGLNSNVHYQPEVWWLGG